MKLCRLCAEIISEDDSYITVRDRNSQLCKKVFIHLELQMISDSLPRQICKSCAKKVNDFHDFYIKVHETQKYLETRTYSPVDENILRSDDDRRQQLVRNPLDNSENVMIKAENKFTNTEKSNEKIVLPNAADISASASEWQSNEDFMTNIETFDEMLIKTEEETVESFENPYLTKDLLVSSENKCLAESKPFIVQAAPETVQTDPFTCDVCFKEFSQKSNLKQHMDVHSEKKFKCRKCLQRFKSKRYLKQHMDVHLEIYKFQCPICLQSFKSKRILRAHVKTHSKESQWECDRCTKIFKTQKALECHLMAHDMPFKCERCLKIFERKCAFLQHMKTHLKNDSQHKAI